MAKRILTRAVLMLFAVFTVVIPCRSQWTHNGSGNGIEIQGFSDSGNLASVNPTISYCNWGPGYVCWPQWTWHSSNFSYSGSGHVQQCMVVVDSPSTYEIAACLEAVPNGAGAWNSFVKVIHKTQIGFNYTELYSVQVQSSVSLANISQWLYFTTNYAGVGCGHWCNRYDLKYSVDGINWSAIHSFTYLRSNSTAYAAGWFMATPVLGGITGATAHIDNWTKAEAARTPDLTDHDVNFPPKPGKFCKGTTCVTDGQTLPG